MVVNNMRELLLYAEEKKKQRAAEHRLRHAHSGRCSGLTDKEYMRYRVNGKKTYSKARKFTHNRMWKYDKRYTVNQLKEIAKQ
tara:strand:+ start:543 stop:791 length:249 start_codon:yes stop_codon:yes gene_type:complete